MRVAGRELVAPFDSFWEHFRAEIPVVTEHIEEGHSSVFGLQGVDVLAPQTPSWVELPYDDLAYHVAHELMHFVLRERGFPRTGRGRQFGENSGEARIGGDLEEMVIHPPLEKLLLPFGFKRDFVLARMLEGAMNGLTRSPVPEPGSPWFFTWATRYCELRLALKLEEWEGLEAVYRERAPQACDLGDELADIMLRIGWGTREQALEAMIAARDTLGLCVDARVLVIDPVEGGVH